MWQQEPWCLCSHSCGCTSGRCCRQARGQRSTWCLSWAPQPARARSSRSRSWRRCRSCRWHCAPGRGRTTAGKESGAVASRPVSRWRGAGEGAVPPISDLRLRGWQAGAAGQLNHRGLPLCLPVLPCFSHQNSSVAAAHPDVDGLAVDVWVSSAAIGAQEPPLAPGCLLHRPGVHHIRPVAGLDRQVACAPSRLAHGAAAQPFMWTSSSKQSGRQRQQSGRRAGGRA